MLVRIKSFVISLLFATLLSGCSGSNGDTTANQATPAKYDAATFDNSTWE